MSKRRVKRQYHSRVRTAAAEGTRAAITAAARRLFASRGYTGTPIDRIAREAGVAVPTVYAAFGTKGAILESVLDAMEHEADLSAVIAALEGGSVASQRDALARFLTQLFTKGADVIVAARVAGDSDPGLRILARRGMERHRQGMKKTVAAWAKAGALRKGLSTADAGESLSAITSYTLFAELKDSGWSARKYEAWLVDAINRLIMTPWPLANATTANSGSKTAPRMIAGRRRKRR
ncbi:MAG: helix-turn-helix domain-containing protein [Vicinamibacterales bacterium]